MPITHTYHDPKTGVDLIIEEGEGNGAYGAGYRELTYKLAHNLENPTIGFSCFTPMGGCKQAILSHNSSIYSRYRGNGFGGACLRARMKIFKDAYAEVMYCTVNSNNAAELHLLRSHGFTQTFSWHSRYENGSAVLMFCKNLNEV